MKKYIIAHVLSIFVALHGMDTPEQPHKALVFDQLDQWEFFSEPNSLDKLESPVPFWDKNIGYAVETAAHLHILKNSNLKTKDLYIFDTECSSGHTSYFLAQTAKNVSAYSNNEQNIQYARAKFKQRNLRYCDRYSGGFPAFDLIVSCHPTADLPLFQKLTSSLKPQGEIFSLFHTQSNRPRIETEALNDTLPKAKKHLFAYDYRLFSNFLANLSKESPTDDILKNMIAQSNFEIIAYEKRTCNILIKDKQSYLDTCKSFFMKLTFIRSSCGDAPKKKLANLFARKMIEKLKKDVSGNWLYPFECTIVHIRKGE